MLAPTSIIAANKQKALRSTDLRDENTFRGTTLITLPTGRISLGLPTKSQPVTGRPGLITNFCVHKTDSGTRSSKPLTPAHTNRRLSGISGRGQVFLQRLFLFGCAYLSINRRFCQQKNPPKPDFAILHKSNGKNVAIFVTKTFDFSSWTCYSILNIWKRH